MLLKTISKAINLVSLQLYKNNLTGQVPTELGKFKKLVNLSLYENQLTGPLPQKIGSWAKFNSIYVSDNFLTGPIPSDMCKQGTMKKLLVLNNKFIGKILANYATCTTLICFRVPNNLLSGTVPGGIWGLPNANIIDITSNNIQGPITPDIKNAKSLGNCLSETIAYRVKYQPRYPALRRWSPLNSMTISS